MLQGVAADERMRRPIAGANLPRRRMGQVDILNRVPRLFACPASASEGSMPKRCVKPCSKRRVKNAPSFVPTSMTRPSGLRARAKLLMSVSR